jgi:hypothetical protein
VVAPVHLIGEHAHDFCPFPAHRRLDFEIEVFNFEKYRDGDGYCPGRDSFADGVIGLGIWESFETRAIVEILATSPPGFVLDVGASVGWYTMIAALTGRPVIAWEPEPSFCEVLRRNVERTGRSEVVDVREEWIDSTTPELLLAGEVTLIKVDTEGMEQEALAMCWDLIEERRVRYMLLEVSPCFRDGYDVMLAQLGECGYDAFRVPDKLCEYRDEFGRDPLGVLERTRIEDVYAYVAGIRQENVLMRRR